MERKYWILTVQKSGNFSTNTIWYYGTLSTYLLIERELGRKTNIVFAHQINQDEYEYVQKELKKNKYK